MDASLYATEIVRGLFGPSIEPVLSSHTCSHNLHSGRLYIAPNALCFYSNIFGFERRLLIPILDITSTGTMRTTSIIIRTKNNRSNVNVNDATFLSNGKVNNKSCNSVRTLGDGFNKDENDICKDNDTNASQASSLFQSHEISSTDTNNEEKSEINGTRNAQSLVNGNATVAEQQARSITQRETKNKEDLNELLVVEEFKEEERFIEEKGSKNPTSEEEYVFKSFEDRDSVLKILALIRTKISKNSATVYSQNEGSGPSFSQIGGNTSLHQRMAAFSGKLRNDITCGKVNKNIVRCAKKTLDSKKKKKKRCESIEPSILRRSDSNEDLCYSVKRDDSKDIIESSKDNNDNANVDVTPSSPPPNRCRSFTAPDPGHNGSLMCQDVPPPVRSISTKYPNTTDQYTLPSGSQTSSTGTSAEHIPVSIGLSHQTCPNRVSSTNSRQIPSTPPPITIVSSKSSQAQPSPPLSSQPSPLKIICKQSDWTNAKEMFKDYNEIAVKNQFIPSKSLDAFYDLFLADHAPHSIPAFQESVIGDKNVTIQPWQQQQKHHVEESGVLSMSPVPYRGNAEQQQRTITFSHPRQAPLGPSVVHTTKTQVCHKFHPYGLLLYTNTAVKNVMYSDCFVVEEVWIVEYVKRDDEGNSICYPHTNSGDSIINLSIRFRVRFVKSTMFKKLIVNQVRTEVSDWYQSYMKMVMSSLEPNNVNGDENNSVDSTITNHSDGLTEVKEMSLEEYTSCGLEIKRGKSDMSSLPISSGSMVESRKLHKNDLSSFWSAACLQAPNSLTPTVCMMVVLLWTIFYILSMNRKMEHLEEELKIMKIENAFVMKTLMNAISIDSAVSCSST